MDVTKEPDCSTTHKQRSSSDSEYVIAWHTSLFRCHGKMAKHGVASSLSAPFALYTLPGLAGETRKARKEQIINPLNLRVTL